MRKEEQLVFDKFWMCWLNAPYHLRWKPAWPTLVNIETGVIYAQGV